MEIGFIGSLVVEFVFEIFAQFVEPFFVEFGQFYKAFVNFARNFEHGHVGVIQEFFEIRQGSFPSLLLFPQMILIKPSFLFQNCTL